MDELINGEKLGICVIVIGVGIVIIMKLVFFIVEGLVEMESFVVVWKLFLFILLEGLKKFLQLLIFFVERLYLMVLYVLLNLIVRGSLI